ncbi:hypothetical protein GCM10010339_92530 [Streptomyces alanosinicus]|uniref:DDE Tnp4 domain-containing protein n=1 Tax=Streptomyces alanosinicus TaxID=68171 RepID=A0A919D9M6_9ACTN|nr:hypothetical protein GCM10010339_92530 [Streptomyces alanosinicus]
MHPIRSAEPALSCITPSHFASCRTPSPREGLPVRQGHLGFIGLDDSGPDADPAVITGYKAARNRPLTRGQKLSNKALAAVRAPVEHGFAHLKN